MKGYRFESTSHDEGTSPCSTIFYLASLSRDDLKHFSTNMELEMVSTQDAVVDEGSLYLALLTQTCWDGFIESAYSLCAELDIAESGFTLLVNRQPPPAAVRRCDGEITTFICSRSVWDATLKLRPVDAPSRWCYELIAAFMDGRQNAEWLSVRQIPYVASICNTTPKDGSLAIVMAHRGPVEYLRCALSYCTHLHNYSQPRCLVGLDVEDLAPYADLMSWPNAEFASVENPPAGPYVIREALINKSSEDLILFQDSDDISCTDRAIVLRTEMMGLAVDMIGSHEVEVNEIDRVVRVYRFPTDVSSVLGHVGNTGISDNALEPFLHATALIKRRKFVEAGGFSTNRRIANDSQLLLRAYFSMTIANVDEFLYLRRVHANALTVDPATRNGSQLRKDLSNKWGKDFTLVKSGMLRLEDSSLVAIKESMQRRIEPVSRIASSLPREVNQGQVSL